MMWPDLVVLPEPNIDGDLGLSRAVEPFCIQGFVMECSAEPFVVSVSQGLPE